MHGAVRRWPCEFLREDSGRVRFVFDVSVVGRAAEACLLATAVEFELVEAADAVGQAKDLSYDVSIVAPFGIIRRAPNEPELVGQRCYAAFLSRSAPCDACPCVGLAPGEARQGVVQGHDGGEFQVVLARALDASTATVLRIEVAEGTVASLMKAKIDVMAQKAGLSKREREVLDFVLLGSATQETAKLLRITARTVKHHQANALRKLGAESRVDLLRLFL